MFFGFRNRSSDNKKQVNSPCGLSITQWVVVVCIFLSAYGIRSFGGFDRYPSSGDERAILANTFRLETLLKAGNLRYFTEGLFDFYTRPSVYILNIAGTLGAGGGRVGLYFLYTLFALFSIFVISLISLKVFEDNCAAIGTLFLGALSTLHINYSMKILSNIPCLTLISISLYFFIQSLYGSKKTRDKILAGIFIGIAFTCHNSAGPFPFIYVISEIYTFLKGKNREGWGKRFALLLFFMAFPVLLWEAICLFVIHSGKITYPYFHHYLKKLIHHENLGFSTPISRAYFLGLIMRLESVVFPIFVLTGLVGILKLPRVGEKEKLFLIMPLILGLFYAKFLVLSCIPRLVFPLYVFLLPIGGKGLSLAYRAFLRKGKILPYALIFLSATFMINNALTAAQTIAEHQEVPKKMFGFLKEKKVSKVIVSHGSLISVPYLDLSRDVKKVEDISDNTGYPIKFYFANTPRNAIILAKEKNIKYMLVNYLSYDFRLGWPRHFMYFFHKRGLGMPIYLLGPKESFPIPFLEEEPFRYLAYVKEYVKGREPLRAESLIYHSMIYDISDISL